MKKYYLENAIALGSAFVVLFSLMFVTAMV